VASNLTTLVRFWGTRGSIPTPGPNTCRYGGNTSCVEIESGGLTLICDSGTGIRSLGLDWLARSERPLQLHLVLSHTHFDHIQGFPFFAPIFNKDVTLTLHTPKSRRGSVRDRIFGMLVPDYCPVGVRELAAQIVEVPFDRHVKLADNLELEALEQVHPGGSFGYALEHAGKRIVYATDSELDARLLNANSAALSPDDERRFPPEVSQFYENADLVIADAQYTDEEYVTRRGWGHPRFTTVVDLAITARVRRLALFHHDPRRSDADMDAVVEQARKRARSRGASLEIFGAVEGNALEL